MIKKLVVFIQIVFVTIIYAQSVRDRLKLSACHAEICPIIEMKFV